MGYYNSPQLYKIFKLYLKNHPENKDPLAFIEDLHKKFGQITKDKNHERNRNRARQTLYLFVLGLIDIFQRNMGLSDVPRWILIMI